MLATLRIKNLALVEDLTVEFEPGFNVITGETGAGKSILIGALNLLLGHRAERSLLRGGAEVCTVEAVFDVSRLQPPLAPFLEENGLEPCPEGQLLVKRSFQASGANRQFVNGSPCALSHLAALGDRLVDLHGPHDHHSLLQPSRQLALLDAFAGLEAWRAEFAGLLATRKAIDAARTALSGDDDAHRGQLDLLRFQVNEIEAARLSSEEDPAIESEYRRASQAARLGELAKEALNRLAGEEDSVTQQAGALGRALHELKRLDPEAGCLLSLHEEGLSFFRDLRSDLEHYADKLEIEPGRLRELEQRMDLIQSLKRKYGNSIEAILAFGDQAREKLRAWEGRGGELLRLQKELASCDASLSEIGRKLTDGRRKAIPDLARAVGAELATLGFNQARFDAALRSPPDSASADSALAPASSTGFDTLEFEFAPNPGEPSRPLRAIASSGELARVMLALKTVLTEQDDVPVLVFDEVDANVAGETAGAIGERMSRLGRHHQVLCITHLAPVAARAGAHFVVSKQTRLMRTTTQIRKLAEKDRPGELARMLGGQTDAALKHARSLLDGNRGRR